MAGAEELSISNPSQYTTALGLGIRGGMTSDKQYIIINLNKAESAETLQARVKERVRWGFLVF